MLPPASDVHGLTPVDKSKNCAEPHGVALSGDSGAGPETGMSFHGGDGLRLDTGESGDIHSNLGAPKAEGGCTTLAGMPEAEPPTISRGVAQLAERVAHNHEVAGSTPASATMVTQGEQSPGAADAGPDTTHIADPSADLPPLPWPCSPPEKAALRGLFPHQRFG